MPIYLTLQLTGGAAHHVAMMPGGLLPRLFTLTCTWQAVVFCHLQPQSRPRLPVRKCDALCCPDFPLDIPRRSKETRATDHHTVYIFANILLFSECGAFCVGKKTNKHTALSFKAMNT